MIGNKSSSIIKGMKNPGRQLGSGYEKFMRAEHGLETYGKMWQLQKGTGRGEICFKIFRKSDV